MTVRRVEMMTATPSQTSSGGMGIGKAGRLGKVSQYIII